ncbi:hypothetical protein ACFFJX_16315 [Pseudarcicella hirudinis]|uniref:hypothetical protein n=1 Tax=Pseudarcicella hirudinis TaxID=1079859 RepID=UPI0035EA1C02
MKVKNILILSLFVVSLLGFGNQAKAQLYNSALGLRLGATNGITFKSFVKIMLPLKPLVLFVTVVSD